MRLPGTQASLGPGVVENPIHSGTLFKKGQLELQQDVGVALPVRNHVVDKGHNLKRIFTHIMSQGDV